MLDNIIAQIQNYVGYEVPSEDMPLLGYILAGADAHILNTCNLSSIPLGLTSHRDSIVISKYLLTKKDVILGDARLNVVKSIKEGDTTVDFGGSTPEQRYNSIIAMLAKEGELACYRKIRW